MDKVVNGANELGFLSPWAATIRLKNTGSWGHQCGAVIIGKQWLLTAAHCITGMKSFDLNFKKYREDNFHLFEEKYKNKINIRVGDYINDDSDSTFSQWEHQQDIDIDRIIVHRNHCPMKMEERKCSMKKNFDIALIRLKDNLG